MKKKKVIHIVPTFGQGGVQTGMLYSLQELSETYDYKILVITDIDTEWIKNLSPLLRANIIETGSSSLIAGWVKGYKILKQLKPDIIISSLWKSVILSASFKILNRQTALAGFFHTAFSPHFAYNFFCRILINLQDLCFADSQATKDYIQKRYNVKKAVVIPYLFSFIKRRRTRKFDAVNIRFVYFGRIAPFKNIDRSLAFCKLCSEQGLNFTFDLYTSGAVEIYQKKIDDLGLTKQIALYQTVPLDHVMEKMLGYDFLLQLSNYEGMALSVVEAMNCGLVPVVTPVGEISRYSKDGASAVWLDAPFDNNLFQLVEKLKNIIADPEKYYTLSAAAEQAFVNYKKYSEAMIEAIDYQLQAK